MRLAHCYAGALALVLATACGAGSPRTGGAASADSGEQADATDGTGGTRARSPDAAGVGGTTEAPDGAPRIDDAGGEAAMSTTIGDAGAVAEGGGVNRIWDDPMAGAPPWSGPVVPATVTVLRGSSAGRLPPAFVGFSYEKTHLSDGYFSGADAALIALYKLLGPGLVRIGGNAVDRSTWVPDAPAAAGGVSTKIGTADVDALADFLKATGWRALYGVNLLSSTPALATDEVKYVSGKLKDSLYGIEIGNEINYFGSYGTVKAKWESFAAAIKAAVPSADLAGPAVDRNVTTWAVPFAHDEAGKIVLLTQHYYRGNGASGTMAALLNPDPALTTELQQLAAAATTNHLRDSFRLGETNSFVNHGTPGVSDTLGAALWSIDFMFRVAQHGSSGVNFHGGGVGQDPKHATPFAYTPLDEANGKVTGVRPLFYGMLLVALAGSGDLPATTTKTTVNLDAYAVNTAGAINVVLVNKDATSGVKVTLDLGAPVATTSAIYLLGAGLTAKSGLTLGGAEISTTGAWPARRSFALAPAGQVVTLVIPAASAALVHAR